MPKLPGTKGAKKKIKFRNNPRWDEKGKEYHGETKNDKVTETKKELNEANKRDKREWGELRLRNDTAIKRYKNAVHDSNMSKEDKELAKRLAELERNKADEAREKRKGNSWPYTHWRREKEIIKNVEAGKKLPGKKKKK